MGSGLRGLALVLTLASAGCAGSAERHARGGELKDLGAEIQAKIDAGSLTRAEAARIAEATLAHEIEVAGGATGVARIREMRACARSLDGALARREELGDAVSVEAAWARALYGGMSDGDARAYATAADARLRAIAALGLVRDEDASLRRGAMSDPLAEARRGAVRAAAKAKDLGDVDELARVARLDPDLLVRSEAVRALGAIGGPAVAGKLRDLWTAGDEAVRGEIGVLWASPEVFPYGGEEALRTLLGTQHGEGALEAAAAVLRARAASDVGPSREVRDLALSLLARAIESDARRGRLHAIAIAPLGRERPDLSPLVQAVRAATKDDDLEVRVSAWARLVERTEERDRAISELRAIAGRGVSGPSTRLTRRALFALATAGDGQIQAWLERELGSPEPEARLSALVGLVALSRGPRGAALLADPDPSLRTRAACTLVLATRRP